MARPPVKIKPGYSGPMAICVCNRSHDMPYCDGRHKAVGKLPIKFWVESGQEYSVCLCGESATAPFCDGSQPHCKGMEHAGPSGKRPF